MRKSVAKCSVALLAVTLVGFVLIFAQIVLPAPAYSRQIPSSLEEGGDPDGLDAVMIITDKIGGPMSASEVEAHDSVGTFGGQKCYGFPSRAETGVFRAHIEKTLPVLKFWFHILSFAFAF